jgi:7-keto-8-aminopelargonate synthetase-like enzyme
MGCKDERIEDMNLLDFTSLINPADPSKNPANLRLSLPPQIFAMNEKLVTRLQTEIEEIKASGLYKNERVISSPQGAEIVVNGQKVLNFCANNYLGLSSHAKTVEAAHKYIDSHGFGMSSVRFICGTQDIHKELEQKVAEFLGTEDTILYAAALMRMAAYLNRCLTNRMPLFLML